MPVVPRRHIAAGRAALQLGHGARAGGGGLVQFVHSCRFVCHVPVYTARFLGIRVVVREAMVPVYMIPVRSSHGFVEVRHVEGHMTVTLGH